MGCQTNGLHYSCTKPTPVVNPGFEDNDKWVLRQVSGGTGTFKYDNGNANSKPHATSKRQASLKADAQSPSTFEIAQIIDVCPGQVYTLQAWIRGPSAGTFKIEFFLGGDLIVSSVTPTALDTWARLGGTISSANPNTELRIRVALVGNAEIFVDDVTLTL